MMKKAILLLILPLTICISVRSQTNKTGDTYKVGDNIISLGIGLGGSIGDYGGSTQSPGVAAQYERGIWEAGPGVISLGGYLGYKGYKYSAYNGGNSFTQKWNYTILGARGAYHFTGINVENLDVYAGVMLSFNSLSYSYSNSAGFGSSGNYNSALEVSAFGGARYYFAGGLGAFGEVGFGVSALSLGLCYHF